MAVLGAPGKTIWVEVLGGSRVRLFGWKFQGGQGEISRVEVLGRAVTLVGVRLSRQTEASEGIAACVDFPGRVSESISCALFQLVAWWGGF